MFSLEESPYLKYKAIFFHNIISALSSKNTINAQC